MSLRAPNFLKKAGTSYGFCWYSLLNEVAMVTVTELPRNQSILALQKSLGKLAFLLFVHTRTEKCFYATCSAKA